MITAKNLVKSFDGFKALQGASLHVPKGAVYGLVGPNGAGKSTIIRNLTGIYKPEAGEVLIDGQPIWDNKLVKDRIAYIPDDVFYFHNATVEQMAKFYSGMYKNFDMELFNTLEQYFVKVNKKSRMRSLSKGMQKQVAFWLAVSQKPDILILDEPVDGLDPVMRKQVWSILMQEVAEREVTVLVSSHNLRELEDVCDHVGIMSDGSVILERSLEDLQDNTMKIQMAFENEMPDLGVVQDILHRSRTGRVETLILRGNRQAAEEQIRGLNPMFYDVLPLSLEEIFIYELGGENYEVKDILL